MQLLLNTFSNESFCARLLFNCFAVIKPSNLRPNDCVKDQQAMLIARSLRSFSGIETLWKAV